jgi:hypothetical protein
MRAADAEQHRAANADRWADSARGDIKENAEMSEPMDCPKDLAEWVNENPAVMWFVYDVDLMPEQIRTKEEVCALRGFYYGWKACELAQKAKKNENSKMGFFQRIRNWANRARS